MSRTQQFAQSRGKRTLTMASLVALLLVTASFHLAAQNTWTRKADMPTARVGATASLVGNKIYVIGGYASGSVPNLPTNEEYNPQTNTWDTALLSMPTSRSYAASAVINGTIYVLGGGYPTATAVNEAYTPATSSWDTASVDLPFLRRAMGAAVVDSTIYVVGGNYDIRDCYAHDPANPLSPWQPRTPIPVGAALISTTVYNGLVYAFGGAVGGSTSTWVGISKVSAYDPKTDQWIPKQPMPTPRFGLQT
jgi:N-acetylneuraminic acid mutarotase